MFKKFMTWLMNNKGLAVKLLTLIGKYFNLSEVLSINVEDKVVTVSVKIDTESPFNNPFTVKSLDELPAAVNDFIKVIAEEVSKVWKPRTAFYSVVRDITNQIISERCIGDEIENNIVKKTMYQWFFMNEPLINDKIKELVNSILNKKGIVDDEQ